MQNLGIVKPGSTLILNFDTFDGGTGAPITMTGFTTADIEIYKDAGFVTQRASDTGYALLDDGIDIDGTTGIHAYSVDLSSNATTGFYACGSHYSIRIGPVTIDGQTVNFWHAEFTIGQPNAILNTAITSITDQDTFVIDDGPAEADALNGCVVMIQDVASAVQFGFAVVTDYIVTSKTVQLRAGPTYTLAATDSISFFPPVNTAWMGNGASVAQTGNDVGADVNSILADTGTDGVVLAANAITEAKIADNAIATEHIATGAITADSIAANAIGASELATDAIGSAQIATGAITADGIAANAIGASELATDAIGSAQMATDSIDAAALAADALTEIGNIVWDTDATSRQTAGTFGQAIGDPVANTETMYDAVVTDAAGTNVAADIIVIEGQTDDIGVAGAGLSDLGGMSTGMKAEVNVEVDTALNNTALTASIQQAPSTTPTMEEAIMLIYDALIHAVDVTATLKTFKNNAGTVIWKKALSDDATTYTEAESASGPA